MVTNTRGHKGQAWTSDTALHRSWSGMAAQGCGRRKKPPAFHLQLQSHGSPGNLRVGSGGLQIRMAKAEREETLQTRERVPATRGLKSQVVLPRRRSEVGVQSMLCVDPPNSKQPQSNERSREESGSAQTLHPGQTHLTVP